VISDFRVMADQKELFGLVASVRTTRRTFDEIAAGGPRTLARITRLVNGGCRQAWTAIELGYCDNTGEPLAGMMRRGNAWSNTTADHLQVLGDAIASPPKFRRRLMVTADGAAASHGLITRFDQLAARPGYRLT
jgi:hypothetical protein